MFSPAALILLLTSHSALAAQLPPPPPPRDVISGQPPAGLYSLRRDTDYVVLVVVQNDCDTPQVVNLSSSSGPASSGTARPHSPVVLELKFRPQGTGSVQDLSFRAASPGTAICNGAEDSRRVAAIIGPPSEDRRTEYRLTPALSVQLRLTLTPRYSTDPPTEVATTPKEPEPGKQPDDLFKPMPLDDPNRPPAVDPDEVFGGSPDPKPVPLDECGNGSCGGGESYAPKDGGGFDDLFQLIMGEMSRIQVAASSLVVARPPRALNPLGLLAKSASEFIEWWMPRLQAADESMIEQAGLKRGLQFIINSQGGSTGKNLTMQVLNFTGKPVSLQGALALEPLKKDAQQKTMQAFAKLAGRQLPTKVDLSGYCLEFLKLPPMAGQVMRVAPPDLQKKFEPIKRVMSAANRLSQSGALKADSNPASYADAIKQWAIWTTQEKFTESKFGDAFVTHTRKNVEAAGQKWSKQIEDVVRQAVPHRWQDIVQVLKGAGVAVPQ